MTVRNFLHKMSIEVLTVHKECSYENNPPNPLDTHRFIIFGTGFSGHFTYNPPVGKSNFTKRRQSDRARKIRYQTHTGPGAAITTSEQSIKRICDIFPLIINCSCSAEGNRCTDTACIDAETG